MTLLSESSLKKAGGLYYTIYATIPKRKLNNHTTIKNTEIDFTNILRKFE